MAEFVLHHGDVPWIECQPLSQAGFANVFSTRHNGNLTYKNGDPIVVSENRARLLNAIFGEQRPIATAHQTHSANAMWVRTPDEARAIETSARENKIESIDDCDALLTAGNDFFVGVKTADCVPLLIADPRTGVMAAVHSGWKGTSLGIARRAVIEMKKEDSHPPALLAAIGPSACGRCYEVGNDVVRAMKEEFDDVAAFFHASSASEKSLFNNSLAVYTQLLQAGLTPANIFVSDYCTIHQNDLFFSHRKEAAGGADRVGRLLSIIGRVG